MKIQFTINVTEIQYINTYYMQFTYTEAYHDILRQIRNAAIIKKMWRTGSSSMSVSPVLSILPHQGTQPDTGHGQWTSN